MSSFFRGFLCGVGIAFIIAPMRGEEMRRRVGERLQTLRGSSLDTGLIQSDGQSIADRVTQSAPQQPRMDTTTPAMGESTAAPEAPAAPQTSQRGTLEVAEMAPQASQRMPEIVQTPPASPVLSSREPTSTGEPSLASTSLSTIPGMEPEVQRSLEEQGITTISQLLEQTSSKENRSDLAHNVGITGQQLKTLVDRADLMQLQGVSADVATLLEEAGVGGCKDLQRRNPEHLHATLSDWQKSGMAATPVPTLDQLTAWIGEAKAAVAQREA